MNEGEMIGQAKKLVLERRPESMDISVVHSKHFFQGTVIVIDSQISEKKNRDYVYFDDNGVISHSQNFEAFLESFSKVGESRLTLLLYGIGGILAIGVVGTVCYLAATTGKVPETLSAAVTTILGFFFGSVATSKKK